eukprot:PhF_6_TR7830/c1_g1_i4/m.11331
MCRDDLITMFTSVMTDAEVVPQVPPSESVMLQAAQHQFRTQGLHAINSLGIGVVFTSRLRFRDSSVVGFVWRGVQGQFPALPEAIEVVRGNTAMSNKTTTPPTVTTPLPVQEEEGSLDTLRALVTVRSVGDVVGTTTTATTDAATLSLARAFILHTSMLESIPLRQRAFEIHDGTPRAIEFFQQVSGRAAAYLPIFRNETRFRGDTTVCDLFDGRLFTHIVQCVVRGDLPQVPAALGERAGALWRVIPGLPGSQPLLPIEPADFGPLGKKINVAPSPPTADEKDQCFPDLTQTPMSLWTSKPRTLD